MDILYYRSLNGVLKEKYGCKVYKLSLSSGLSCPNRDGRCGKDGCIFCSPFGSGEFSENPNLSIKEQIALAKERVSKKIRNGKYIAYFQSFSNTYGDVEYLRKIFHEAIEPPEIVELSVATRPDCLPKEVLELLSELNKIKPVTVELGLQTVHKTSADYIRRGYDLEVYETAVENLKEIGVSVVTHMIIGLPNETEEMIIETARYIGKHSDGVKFHLLHIINDTDLETEYQNGRVKTLELSEYVRILAKCVEVLPSTAVIHRLTGDGDKKTLAAPLYSANKKYVLNTINKYFTEHNITEGKNFI